MGMNDPENLLIGMFDEEHDTHCFDSTGRRSRHPAQEQGENEDDLREGRPPVIVGCYESGGCDGRTHLKRRIAKCFPEGVIDCAIEIQGNHMDEDSDQAKKYLPFRIFPENLEIPLEKPVVEGKVDSRNKHEHNDNRVKA